MAVYSGDPTLDGALERWLKIDECTTTRNEVLADIENQRWEKLRKTMLDRLKFGTAGLRGPMGAGYMCMNEVVVLQTAQGICSYVKKVSNREQLENGSVIGFDGRYNSKRFAELTAKVFASSGLRVKFFSKVCPTPFVSFATTMYGAAVGIMVTASHNPKEDNGYKVYWSSGSQVIAPHDNNILEEIWSCLDIPSEHWDTDQVMNHKLVMDCTENVITGYLEYIRDSLHDDIMQQNRLAGIQTVYSAMHGVGYEYIAETFEAANLQPPISVVEQQDPDPEFPTVKFPNPEEEECLELSKQLAEDNGVQLVLVNDPDADRLAVAEYNKESKSWKVFTGNEMGSLLGWWLLEQYTYRNRTQPVYLLASFVSSKMLRAIAKGRGELVETLTGFKWMGNASLLLMQQQKMPLFAFEEAIGYMCSPRVPDKDGISAAIQVASLASMLYTNGSSLADQLQKLYQKYGYHISLNSYYIVKDQNVIQKIFSRIRNFHGPGLYPKKVGPCKVISINDFAAGVKIPEEDNKDAHLKVLGTGLDSDYTSGEMITFSCSSGMTVSVRTSGTEPKLKYYTELVCQAPTIGEQEEKKMEMEKMVKEFIDVLLQPEENGLVG